MEDITEQLNSKFEGQKKVFLPLKNNGNSKGIGFITFDDPALALAVNDHYCFTSFFLSSLFSFLSFFLYLLKSQAKEQFNGTEIGGRNIVVEFAEKDTVSLFYFNNLSFLLKVID